jgi:2-enoate reductase
VFISGASDLVDLVHDHGAKICIQITAGEGRQQFMGLPEKVPPAPSPVPAFKDSNVICRALTKDEIKGIVHAFADAAQRAVMAGFDMIEFHGHTGYLIDQFLTPLWNKRTDEYGGDIDGRMRFPLELISAARAVVGPDFPLCFRLTADNKLPGGKTIADSLEIAKRVEAAGIDVLSIDGGCYDAMPWIFPPSYYFDGCMVDLAAAIKKVVNIPVMTVGRINRPEFAEQILEEGKADFIAIGRQLIADPDWANKARDGKVEDIRPCIICNEFCIGRIFFWRSMSCSVNAQVGKEQYYEITRAKKVKRVIVIGGGPGGMEAARVAALRGHEVTLYEKENTLGGQLKAASKPPFKVELQRLVDYLSVQMDKLGVRVKLETEVTPELIARAKPDAVVVATGASPVTPSFPGIENANILTAVDLLMGKRKVGNEVIVLGASLVGCDTALYLAREGKRVTIFKMRPGTEVAEDLNPPSRQALLEELTKFKVTIITNSTIKEFTARGLVAIDKNGKEKTLKAETIVLALGSQSENKLLNSIKGKVGELYAIGDCVTPRKVGQAMHEGFLAGWKI